MGAVEVRMRYLPSTWIPCAECDGQRFSDEVLAATVDFGGVPLSIAQVYEQTIADMAPRLLSHPQLDVKGKRAAQRMLQALVDMGLGYLELGQPSPTLSGGEAQRVKLAKELGKRSTGRTIYILDEPTTGLHFYDISRLLTVLQRLVESGNSVVIIEHNLDVIKTADYLIDLGPEGGSRGGEIVACGTPEDVARCSKSYTGRYLRSYLDL